jgi:hypothetical protein
MEYNNLTNNQCVEHTFWACGVLFTTSIKGIKKLMWPCVKESLYIQGDSFLIELFSSMSLFLINQVI